MSKVGTWKGFPVRAGASPLTTSAPAKAVKGKQDSGTRAHLAAQKRGRGYRAERQGQSSSRHGAEFCPPAR
jgi:hypothetical protein